eukprot:TRINITY_DN80409_c0_g1_i1.p1 TRINITY_DN80409_c0_g1~~TRINITY_DN80409_c0_g1_i1.p1  ORF type:complete len:418 (-),score=126.23 TRINITY_DN80409_c0_g1_i1:46-1299(-)
MSSVKDVVKFLGRYADLMTLMAIVPLLSHLKFGKLLASHERSQRAALEKAAEADKAAAKKTAAKKDAAKADAAKKADEARETPAANDAEPLRQTLPPALSLFLLMLAELLASVELLDPSESHVKKAMGEFVKLQKKSKGGFSELPSMVDKLLGSDDVFDLIVFVASMSGLSAMFFMLVFKLEDLDMGQKAPSMNPLETVRKSLRHVVVQLCTPKLWCSAILAAVFVMGNWSSLGKLLRRPGILDFLRSLARPLRTGAVFAAMLETEYEGPMPLWATIQIAGAVARAGCFFVYERLSSKALLGDNLPDFFKAGGSAVVAARGVLLLEALCLLVALPCALRKTGLGKLILPLLVTPSVYVLTADASFAIEFDEATRKVSMAMVLVSMTMVFMGGLMTMLVCIGIVQLLIRIHNIEKMKV